jgi:tripartite-type tricarboxylate transporter receptor subunit TctC
VRYVDHIWRLIEDDVRASVIEERCDHSPGCAGSSSCFTAASDQQERDASRNRITRREFSTAIAAAAASSTFPMAARAQQNYPSRPVRFILPFGAARSPTSPRGWPRKSSATSLGSASWWKISLAPAASPPRVACSRRRRSGLARSRHQRHSISAAIYKALPFDPVKEFATISTIGAFDLFFAVNTESEFKTLPDFIKAARAQPGKLNVGTINVGGTQNLAAELLKSSAGVDFQIIPYRGTPDVIVALLRNDVQMLCEFYAPIKPTLADNKIRAVASTGTQRSPFLPDVPTAAEAGVAGYEVTSWNGLFAPAGTPADIINLLNKTIREIVAIPEVKQKYADLGSRPRPARPRS